MTWLSRIEICLTPVCFRLITHDLGTRDPHRERDDQETFLRLEHRSLRKNSRKIRNELLYLDH
jgi:hypothetical protein